MNLWPETEERPVVTVASFLEAAGTALDIELHAGAKGLQRPIPEAALNRPGLALCGFFKHFPNRRIQLLGLSELAYLSSLSEAERCARLEAFFKRRMPCLVVARHKRLFPEIAPLAERYEVPVLRSSMITMNFVNAATILMENLMAPRLKVQGTMLEIMGMGVLIMGRSGIGKSDTALGLIKQGHALVADDITQLRLDSAGCVIAAAVKVTRYHMEIRGVGIIHVPALYGVGAVRGEKKLDLIAVLSAPTDAAGARVLESHGVRRVFGVPVSEVVIVVTPGRDLGNVIEAAARNEKLRSLGHDAEKELDTQLMQALRGGRQASE